MQEETGFQEVEVAPRSIDAFESQIRPDVYSRFRRAMERSARRLRGRRVWNVNSTADGGGVAEMLRFVVAYERGAGIDARWLVVDGDEEFFVVTKRLHHRLHGHDGDGGPLGTRERNVLDRTLAPAIPSLVSVIEPGDIVIVHDPQPASLTPWLKRVGAIVIWRSHIGSEFTNEHVGEAWGFLRRCLDGADALVFSKDSYAWDGLPEDKVWIIPPAIDAFSAKNQALTDQQVSAIVAATGIVKGRSRVEPLFHDGEGRPHRLRIRADIVESAPIRGPVPIVLQVARWDPLKDPIGVMKAFADHVVADPRGPHLVLAGPPGASVGDDPEGSLVFDACVREWASLPRATKDRIHLVTLPMDDQHQSGVAINALQRRADVVIQKSLAEGFGLTVAEAMWKARPLVASKVGGIRDQIVHRRSGILVEDPKDLRAFGEAARWLLSQQEVAAALGTNARERVRDGFLAPRLLSDEIDLLDELVHRPSSGRPGEQPPRA